MDTHDYPNSAATDGESPAYFSTPPECHASKSKGKNKTASGRKNTKWGRHEHTIFICCCEGAIRSGHQEGKCFTKIRIRLAYKKFKSIDCKEIYKDYTRLNTNEDGTKGWFSILGLWQSRTIERYHSSFC